MKSASGNIDTDKLGSWGLMKVRIVRSAILTVLAGIALTACASNKVAAAQPGFNPPEPVNFGRWSDVPQKLPNCGNLFDCFTPEYKTVIQNPLTVSQATLELSGKTGRSYSPAHGTQVAYLSPDSRVFLWYPGNAEVLVGEWKVATHEVLSGVPQQMRDQMAAFVKAQAPTGGMQLLDIAYLCFRYAGDSYDPATGGHGAVWECGHATEYVRLATKETADGDLFGLATRKRVPAVIPRGEPKDYDFAALDAMREGEAAHP